MALDVRRIVTRVSNLRELSVHDVSFEQDHRLAVFQEASAFRFHFVDGVDSRQRHAEAFSSGYQVVVAQQLGTVAACQAGLGLGTGNAIGYQANFQLVGAYGDLGGVTVVAVRYQVGTVPVEVLLQNKHRLRAVAVAKGGGHALGLNRAATLPRERKIRMQSSTMAAAWPKLVG